MAIRAIHLIIQAVPPTIIQIVVITVVPTLCITEEVATQAVLVSQVVAEQVARVAQPIPTAPHALHVLVHRVMPTELAA